MSQQSFHQQTANGSNIAFTITTFSEDEIKVYVDGVESTNGGSSQNDYTIPNYTTTGGTVTWNTTGSLTAPASPKVIRIVRQTDLLNNGNTAVEGRATYSAGSSVKADDLNNNQKQVLRSLQEHNDQLIQTYDVENAAITTAKIKDAAVTSLKIEDGTIVNADINASAAIAGTKISPDFGSQNIVTSGTVDGRDVSADGTKLDGIETGATGDQTNTEIRAAVEAATDSNVFTDADHTKLNGIETGATADQTGAEIKTAYEAESNTNAFTDAEKTKLGNLGSLNALSDVNTSGVADGKILKYQASSSSFIIADDGGGGGGGGSSTFTGLSDTPANFGGAAGKTVKVNSGGTALEFVTVATPSSDVVDDTSPQLGGNLDVQTNEITTSTTNGNVKVTPNGTGLFEVKGNTNAGTLQLNCENNSHGIKLKSPPHSASASYTLTFPNNVVNGQFLKTDTNGNLSWAAVDLTALSASNLTSGTVPDARFPATLPAVSGANLTNLDAADLASGTIPDARFPATLPAVSGANLTNLPASAYNISINTLSSSSGSGGGSATFNGSATRFTLSNAGTNAQAHIVSVNGVIQKPNSGTSPSEGFAIDGNDIIFASAPASGSDFFILTLGNAINLSVPADNSVTSAKIADGTIVNGDIADDTISEAKLDIHAAPSGTDKVLGYTANGMEWVTAAAGATGGGTDKIFYENGQTVTTNYTITNNTNAMSAGPVTINSGVAVTIGTGENWTIV